MTWDIVLFAGGKSSKMLKERTGAVYRSLITLQGKPVVLPAITAFLQVPQAQIEIYGPEIEFRDSLAPHLSEAEWERLRFRPLHKEGLASQVLEAVSHREEETPLVLSAADLPLLRSTAVLSFLAQASQKRGIVYPVIPREALDSSLVRSRTFLRTKEGTFTGGNLMAGLAGEFQKASGMMDSFISRRKSPLGLAKLLGWGFLMGVMMGRWNLGEISERIESNLGIPLNPLSTTAFGLGADLDKLSDYLLFQDLLDSKEGNV
ncbi:nucleotidyltransferase family protein [bacterium]|nr:nucleotidyltransferase family protein [bacterium]